MNVALDISSVIWDNNLFEADASCYYQLADEFIHFIDAFDRVDAELMMRQELLDEMLSSFPFDLTDGIPYFKEFKNITYRFLSNISETIVYGTNILPELVSIPNISHKHFSEITTLEYKYLIYEMHTMSDHIAFCTFSAVWANGELKTKCPAKTKTHHTLVHPSASIESYLDSFKKKFEPNPKHGQTSRIENGKEVSPLSCYDGKNDTKVQWLLDSSHQGPDGKKRYAYDTDNSTYVCFHPHEANKYHGFDMKRDDVPFEIKEIFHK